jgi:superfamily II DNA or RNA helicase
MPIQPRFPKPRNASGPSGAAQVVKPPVIGIAQAFGGLDMGGWRPRIELRTLGRGDGLLGMMACGSSGPRGPDVTVALLDWLAPGPNVQPHASLQLQQAAERGLAAMGFFRVPPQALQWRAPGLGEALGRCWTLAQEGYFSDFWAESVPQLQALGWVVWVRPGFAHHSVPVSAWRLVVEPGTGEVLGQALDGPLSPAPPPVTGLGLSRREGSWLLSLGVEVDGEQLDLAPMLADLLRRESRWLYADKLALIDALDLVQLRAPGGRRIEAPAGPIKAIVAAMLDVLTTVRRAGPLPLAGWDMFRLDALRQGLSESAQALAQRAGEHGRWQLQGTDGLHLLAQRLGASGGPRAVAPPVGLTITLRPYQLDGLAWLQYLREQQLAGILADDMGLGKTAQTLAHVLLEKNAGRLDLPVLVIVPTSLLFNWQDEARRMAPGLRVLTLHGANRDAAHGRMGDADLVLTTYSLLWRDVRVLAAQPFHLLVLDEAQTVKNAAGRASRAVRRLQARHRLALTGTPLENHLGELWAQFDFLMPGFLGDVRNFQRQWRKPIEEAGETQRAAALARRVRPFILRRRKNDVATELPPVTEVIRRVELQGQQRLLYESVRVAADHVVRRVLAKRGLERAQISVLGALLRLRQVCCDPRLVRGHQLAGNIEHAKLELLCDMLPALVQEGRRVLVFSQFTSLLTLIGEELTALQLPWLALTGRTPPAQRGAVVGQFQAQAVPILLVSLKAGGLGLNLTAADTVIHMDPWWNPAVEAQATARAHRIGQTQNVLVYKLLVQGSIEERMLELQARKQALASGVLGEDSVGMSKFNQADLAGLLAPLDDGEL